LGSTPVLADSVASTPNAIGSIMAVVAVLDIHIERKAAMAPKANMMRAGDSPTQRRESTNRAMRRSSLCTRMELAIKNDPRNKKMMGWPNDEKASRAEATPSGTHSAGPSSAVAARGIASVTQNTMTRPKTAARR